MQTDAKLQEVNVEASWWFQATKMLGNRSQLRQLSGSPEASFAERERAVALLAALCAVEVLGIENHGSEK
jgi:hypothetical protein